MFRRLAPESQTDNPAKQMWQPTAVAYPGHQFGALAGTAFFRPALAHFDLQELSGFGGEVAASLYLLQVF
jgi:uncharacterized protein YdiU (UPF0061 family)